MSQSIFPLLIVDTFITSLWSFDSPGLTREYADANYVRFPIAQGSQTFPLNLSVSGTTTLGTTTADDLRIGDGVNDYSIHLGNGAGLTNQGINSIAIGSDAGETNQGNNSIAIGKDSAGTGIDSIAIGNTASTSTFTTSVAIGKNATSTANNQITLGTATETIRIPGATTATGLVTSNDLRINNTKIHLGTDAGLTNQGGNTIAIGTNAGLTNQGINCIAIGADAGKTNQDGNSVSLGYFAGETNQSYDSFALGYGAGNLNQGNNCVALGALSGSNNQKNNCVAIGAIAGDVNQGLTDGVNEGFSVAIGFQAGTDNQKTHAVAIGYDAGSTSQGAYSVALGDVAGATNLGGNSIAIGVNSSGTGINSIAIGNAASTSTFTTSVAIGKDATSTANNQITLGTATESVRVLGTTTTAGLTLSGATNITLGTTTSPTQDTQLGGTRLGTTSGAALSAGTNDVATITITTSGVYIFNYAIRVNATGPTTLYHYLSGSGVTTIFRAAPLVLGASPASYSLTGVQVVSVTASTYLVKCVFGGGTASIASGIFTATRIG